MRLPSTRHSFYAVLAASVFWLTAPSLAELNITPYPTGAAPSAERLTPFGSASTISATEIVREFGIDAYYSQFQQETFESDIIVAEALLEAEPVDLIESISIEEEAQAQGFVPIEEILGEDEPVVIEEIFIQEEPPAEMVVEEAVEEETVEEEIIEEITEEVVIEETPSEEMFIEEEYSMEEELEKGPLPEFSAFDIEGYYAQFAPKEAAAAESNPEVMQDMEPLSAETRTEEQVIFVDEPMDHNVILIEPEDTRAEIIVIDQAVEARRPSGHDRELEYLRQKNEALELRLRAAKEERARLADLEEKVHVLNQRLAVQQRPQAAVQRAAPRRAPAAPPVQSKAAAEPIFLLDESGVQDWFAFEGQSARDVLAAWSQQEGVRFLWDSQQDFVVPKTLDVRAAYASAVRALLSEYPENEARPLGSLHIDPDTGERILLIQVSDQ